jgi:hypothetical protein
LENAIHLLEKTDRELKLLVEANETDRELNVTPLSGKVRSHKSDKFQGFYLFIYFRQQEF